MCSAGAVTGRRRLPNISVAAKLQNGGGLVWQSKEQTSFETV